MKPGLINKVFLSRNFFAFGSALVVIFAFGFAIPLLFVVGKLGLLAFIALVAVDLSLLFLPGNQISARRVIAEKIGLDDKTPVKLIVESVSQLRLQAEILDELPFQLQTRDLQLTGELQTGLNEFHYVIRPKSRGSYIFGRLNILLNSRLNLVQRRLVFDRTQAVTVFPSVQQMHENELIAFSKLSAPVGFRRHNKIGKSYEFEQISAFTEGDDYRNINWKATSRTRELMVNKFQDERSQNFYCIISKGRAMKMAFNNLSLLDYSINSSLALLNVVLKKYDRAGLITFSDKIGTAIRAENRIGQIQKIIESLYKEKERDSEPSYELLFQAINRVIRNRSFLMLFANFENLDMAMRVLPVLKRINNKHLLVLTMFKDTELEVRANEDSSNVESIYKTTLARKHLNEKEEIAHLMRRQGIHTIVARPEELSPVVIEKYLELKSKGII